MCNKEWLLVFLLLLRDLMYGIKNCWKLAYGCIERKLDFYFYLLLQ